jgi:hypothetical protein
MSLQIESRFVYDLGESYGTYNRTNYMPNFDQPRWTQEAEDLCGKNKAILFEFLTKLTN